MIRLMLPALLLTAPAAAEGEAGGAALFERSCASCHAAMPGAAPGPGPNLAGLAGRRVGGDPRFDFSPVLREAGAHGDSWDRARLERFLADPEEMYPGLWMGGNGLRRREEISAVAGFLLTR